MFDPSRHQYLRPISQPIAVWLVLLYLALFVGGCHTVPDVNGPVVAANTKGAGQLELLSGERYWMMPEQLMFTGSAKFSWPDGRWYQGSWNAGKPNGQGELQLPSGEHYVGEFLQGNRHGFGHQTSNAGRYQGAWENDAAQGQGQFVASNGDSFQGAYHQGQRQGYGELQAADGSYYRGDWYQDQPQGQGELTTADGERYNGAWATGQRNGYGELEDRLGTHYAGTWVAGKRQGFGKLTRPDQSSYEGEWADDQREGAGIETFANGGSYNGEWSYNRAFGSGTRLTRTGIKILGVFNGDRVSNGLLELPNGAEYAGRLFRKQMTEVAAPFLAWTQTQAENGSAAAQWLLAGFYQGFKAPAANSTTALRWYQAAATTFADAQFRSGQLLLDDDPVAAVAYLNQAAEQNHIQAQLLLGQLYHSGRAVSPNANTAIGWYERAANRGNLAAVTQLAWLLATSQEAHARDPKRALALVKTQAEALNTWALLDTLAATYAALDDFEKAVTTQQAAISALEDNEITQLESMQTRLALYQAGKPFVEVVYAGD